jgi:anaerobic C4-dicarboxylate transporter DcuA
VQILAICVPATLMGVIVAALVQTRVGVELEDDPEYQRRLAAGEIDPKETSAEESTSVALPPRAALSAWMFLIGVALIVCCGLFPAIRTVRAVPPPVPAAPATMTATAPATATAAATPAASKRPVVSMPMTIAIVMLALAALMLLFTRAPVAQVVKTKTCQAGLTAVIGILGLAWLGDTFIDANSTTIIGGLSRMVEAYPVLFVVGLFVTSMLLYSQAATTQTLMPLGLALGIPAASLAGAFPAVNGYFFIPTYGTLIAAVNFDRSGTTRIGKYVLNHSFMIPGLVSTTVAVLTGLVIAKLFF